MNKNMFDFKNESESYLTLEDFINGFKTFCYYFEFNYTEAEIEKLKDLYVFNKLELTENQNKTINEIMEVM